MQEVGRGGIGKSGRGGGAPCAWAISCLPPSFLPYRICARDDKMPTRLGLVTTICQCRHEAHPPPTALVHRTTRGRLRPGVRLAKGEVKLGNHNTMERLLATLDGFMAGTGAKLQVGGAGKGRACGRGKRVCVRLCVAGGVGGAAHPMPVHAHARVAHARAHAHANPRTCILRARHAGPYHHHHHPPCTTTAATTTAAAAQHHYRYTHLPCTTRPPPHPPYPTPPPQDVFNQFDVDNSGQLDRRELQRLLQTLMPDIDARWGFSGVEDARTAGSQGLGAPPAADRARHQREVDRGQAGGLRRVWPSCGGGRGPCVRAQEGGRRGAAAGFWHQVWLQGGGEGRHVGGGQWWSLLEHKGSTPMSPAPADSQPTADQRCPMRPPPSGLWRSCARCWMLTATAC